MKKLMCLVTLLSLNTLLAQNLFLQRVRKIEGRKKSVFLTGGIFHGNKNKDKNKDKKTSSNLTGVRHSYSKKSKVERIVFDFETPTPPRFFGHIQVDGRKIYLDFFDTSIVDEINELDKTLGYVQNIDFFPYNGR